MNEAELYLGLVFFLTVLFFVYRFRNGPKEVSKGLSMAATGQPVLFSVPVNVSKPMVIYVANQRIEWPLGEKAQVL